VDGTGAEGGPTMRAVVARGLMLGVIGGLIAGAFEAVTMIGSDPLGRDGLLEAAVYALVIDALVLTVLNGALAFPIGWLGRRSEGLDAPGRLFTVQVATTVGAAVLLIGVIWAFAPPISGREIE